MSSYQRGSFNTHNILEQVLNPEKLLTDFLDSDHPLAVFIREHYAKSGNAKAENDAEDTETTPLDGWMDNQDIMFRFHVSSRYLQSLRSEGKLAYTIVGGKCLYKKRDVEMLLEAGYKPCNNGGTGYD